MATPVFIKHPASGMAVKGYVGFSWTYLFFGCLVPVFRGELGIGALHLLFSVFTAGIWQLVVCFLYNKQYMMRMFEKGYVLADSETANLMARAKLGMFPPSGTP